MIYYIERKDETDWDQCDSLVVRANSINNARELANTVFPSGSPMRIEKVTASGEDKIILEKWIMG